MTLLDATTTHTGVAGLDNDGGTQWFQMFLKGVSHLGSDPFLIL